MSRSLAGVGSTDTSRGRVMWGNDAIASPRANSCRLDHSPSSMPLTVLRRVCTTWVGDLVQDVTVDQAEHLPRQVLRQLRHEGQTQPSLATAFGDPRHLLEQDAHLVD